MITHLRHKNGNGAILGWRCEICPDSFLDKHSYIADKTDVWQSAIARSKVTDMSTIRSSVIRDSYIGGKHPVEIVKSEIVRSTVKGGRVIGALIKDSAIMEEAFVRGGVSGAVLDNCVIKGYATVTGDPVLKGVTLDAHMRVGRGVWTRSPRYIQVGDGDLDCGITESVSGEAYIGCTLKPMAKWIKKSRLWASAAGWSDEMRKQVRQTFEEWLDEPKQPEGI